MTSQQDVEAAERSTSTASTQRRAGGPGTIVNWGLALLTVPVAIAVVVVALGGVMGMASCTGQSCKGPGPVLFSILFYGGPIVSAVAILASFFTARRRWGIAVPLCALGLQVLDLVVLFAAF